jgi:hypothetical protein
MRLIAVIALAASAAGVAVPTAARAEDSVYIYFDGPRSRMTPFVGAGRTLLTGGGGGGVSLVIAGGVQLRRAANHIPFFEVRYLTTGGRIVAILGMLS